MPPLRTLGVLNTVREGSLVSDSGVNCFTRAVKYYMRVFCLASLSAEVYAGIASARPLFMPAALNHWQDAANLFGIILFHKDKKELQ